MTIASARYERADLAASRRAQVLRRLKWAAPGGLGAADIEDRLEWPRGTGQTVLRELEERGEAERRGGCWYLAQGLGRPRPVAGGTAAGHTSSEGSGAVVAPEVRAASTVTPAPEQRAVVPSPARAPEAPDLRGVKGAPRVLQMADLVQRQPGLMPRDYAELAGCGPDAASSALRTARKRGWVRAEGATTTRRYYPTATTPTPAPVDDEPADSTPAPAPSTEGGPPHLRHPLEHRAPVPRPARPAPPAVDVAALVAEWLDGLRPAARAELSAHDTAALVDALRDALAR